MSSKGEQKSSNFDLNPTVSLVGKKATTPSTGSFPFIDDSICDNVSNKIHGTLYIYCILCIGKKTFIFSIPTGKSYGQSGH